VAWCRRPAPANPPSTSRSRAATGRVTCDTRAGFNSTFPGADTSSRGTEDDSTGATRIRANCGESMSNLIMFPDRTAALVDGSDSVESALDAAWFARSHPQTVTARVIQMKIIFIVAVPARLAFRWVRFRLQHQSHT